MFPNLFRKKIKYYISLKLKTQKIFVQQRFRQHLKIIYMLVFSSTEGCTDLTREICSLVYQITGADRLDSWGNTELGLN